MTIIIASTFEDAFTVDARIDNDIATSRINIQHPPTSNHSKSHHPYINKKQTQIIKQPKQTQIEIDAYSVGSSLGKTERSQVGIGASL